jgi:thiol:disulfide interchange protein DsbD
MLKMMRLTLMILAFLSAGVLHAQELNPVNWSYRVEKADSGRVSVYLDATMEGDWHIYSQFLPSDEGPIATSFTWDLPVGAKAVGKVQEQDPITAYDKNFMMDVRYFAHHTTFTQVLEFPDAAKMQPVVTVNYMVCNDEMCLPPRDERISVVIP